jgi:hypothetical protein
MRYHYARRGHFPSGEMTLSDLLDRYALVALSEGQSESSISLVKHSVGRLSIRGGKLGEAEVRPVNSHVGERSDPWNSTVQWQTAHFGQSM